MAGISLQPRDTLLSPSSPACPSQSRRLHPAPACPRPPRSPRLARISCESSRTEPALDRRELLIGLTGLCAAAATGKDVFAMPVQAPNLTQCQPAGTASGADCWPPYTPTVAGYKFSPSERLRIRSSLLKSAIGVSFPLTLTSPVRVAVKRPKVSRLLAENEKEREALAVEGIEFDGELFVKFDVYVDEIIAGEVKPDDSEFAGSFVNVPRRNARGKKTEPMQTNLRLGISELIEDLELDDEEEILVTLVPRSGKGKVKIGGIRIEIAS